MNKVIVPLNAFNRLEVLKNGQASFSKMIKESGAFGIEIRRELLSAPVPAEQLRNMKEKIEEYGLFTVYSAPIELWKENHSLNLEELADILREGAVLGADWIKLSLGHFSRKESEMTELKAVLHNNPGIQVLVENDQTLHGGNISRLAAFFESAVELKVPIRMAFDSGNWHYAGQDVQDALETLSHFVVYLHLKQVEEHNGKWRTIPLQVEGDTSWQRVLRHFPAEMAKALEFPIEPKEKTKQYVCLITELTKRKEVLS